MQGGERGGHGVGEAPRRPGCVGTLRAPSELPSRGGRGGTYPSAPVPRGSKVAIGITASSPAGTHVCAQ